MRYINVSASCHIGNIRDYNEDMILVADKFIRGDAGNTNAAEYSAKDASEDSIKEDTDKQ